MWVRGYSAYSEITQIKQELEEKKAKEENEKKESEKLVEEEKKQENSGSEPVDGNSQQNNVKKFSENLTEKAIGIYEERLRERKEG